MSTGFDIRTMEARDLDGVLAIAASSIEAPQWPRRSYEEILTADPAAAFTRIALVASSVRTLAGFAVANLSRAEGLAELETITVLPGFRRRGAGAGLLASMADSLGRRGARALRLEVRESNSSALALYRSQGFRLMGRRPGYYAAPAEDALILERAIGGECAISKNHLANPRV